MRKSEGGTDDTKTEVTPEVSEANTGSAHPITPLDAGKKVVAIDATSTKKKKKRSVADIGYSQRESAAAIGVQRDVGNFCEHPTSHIIIQSSVVEFFDSVFNRAEKPKWVVDVESWGKDLVKSGLREKCVIRGGKVRSFGVDAGFVYLPTGLGPSLLDRKIPKWNVPDHSIVGSFFKAMDPFLADDGLLAILHTGDYDQISQVISASQESKKFECVGTHHVVMGAPMYKAKTDIQV